MNNKTLVGLVIAVLVIGGIWYFASNKQEAKLETTKVKIANLPITDGLPLYLALEKGYFKDEGLDVELVKFEAPNQLIDAIMAGQVDFTSPSGAMGITGVADFKNPGKVKIYVAAGDDEKTPTDSIFVKSDSSITSIQGLKGKKLGTLPGIQWRTISTYILAKNNLVANKDVTLVELAPSLQVTALASGEIDALLALEPMSTTLKAKGIGKEILHAAAATTIANPFFPGAGAVRLDFAKQNPNTTEKILKVFARAIKEIRENPDQARQYLKGYTPLDDSLIAQASIHQFRMYNEITESDIASIQKFYDIFSTGKVVDGQMDFKHLLYSPNAN